jgi:hypothetical protein
MTGWRGAVICACALSASIGIVAFIVIPAPVTAAVFTFLSGIVVGVATSLVFGRAGR